MAFNYNGVHSITFSDDFDDISDIINPNRGIGHLTNAVNTWTSFKMAPKSRPFVTAPQVKEEYVDVPGADGALDYTEALTGKARYGNRTGSWEFIIDNDETQDDSVGSKWPEYYSKILKTFHGKKWNYIVLDDDPGYYWVGRTSVNGGFGNRDYSNVSISYNLEPYKYPIGKTNFTAWAWNKLFSNTIYYGNFTVYGRKARNLKNDKTDRITATVYCYGTSMKVYRYESNSDLYNMLNNKYEDRECEILSYGENRIILNPGDNKMIFIGNGRIAVSYERGKML